MRYAAEFRRALTGASGVAIDAGKKLLAYLQNQKRLSGVDSLVQRITLDSGEIVEARWDKDLPTVRVYPPGSFDASCEMYVESGLLDLGPNIASDAGDRFNAGLPAFDDSPATLYFGAGVDCTDGLNGNVTVTGVAVRSQCLAEGGASVASRLSSPAKKQAQAALPASCWSGLMQRYVQAIYGGDALNYAGNATTLALPNATLPVADTIGLLDFGGTLGFLIIDGTSMSLREVVPSTACVRAVLNAWASLPVGTVKDKLLTVALSGCLIGNVIATGTIVSGNRHFVNRAAWVFAHDTPTAVAVFEDAGVSTAYEATFSLAGAIVSASLSTLASGDVLNTEGWPLLVADQSPYASPQAHASGFATTEDPLEVGQTWDFPVYAHYNGATPVVVSCSVVTSAAPLVDASTCYSLDNPYGPVIIGSDTSRQCRSNLTDTVSVAYGFYADGWSTVELKAAFLAGDDTSVVRVRSAGYEAVVIDPAVANDTFSVSGDWLHLVPPNAISGPASSGCLTYNETLGTPTTTSDNLPASTACVESFVFIADDTGETAMTRPYYPAAGVLFEGQAHRGGVQVLSLAWGATACLAVDQYSFDGGEGAYISFAGAAHLIGVGGTDRVVDFAEQTINGTLETHTQNIPGDCASGSTVTDSSPFVRIFTKPLPAAEGDLVVGMYGFASPGHDSGRLRVIYGMHADASSIPIDTAYPDPRLRGTETLKVAVFMPGANNDDTDTRQVDLRLVDSAYEHPDGLTTFTANPGAEGDCEAFAYLGLDILSDAHLFGDLASGPDKDFVLQTNQAWLVDGFSYVAGHSLLGAVVAPVAEVQRGNSIGMDRQTITGEYSPVSTPSFVGWA